MVHAALTQKWVEDSAKLAAGLGFGTLIIDDGWCFDTMKRVSPETIGSWYEMIGDWEVSTAKFPDFAAHVERVKAMGLKYMVWVAPFLVGNKSRLFSQIPDALSHEYIEGAHAFDTSFVAEGKILIKKIAGLVAQYKLDGLKIDFLDYARPGLKKPSGQNTSNFIRNLSTAIRQENADALIEFRQSYATPGMMPYATQFRAGDVPFDFMDNFNRLAQIRLSMGDNIPIHADPVFWHPDELPENIARHLIAALVGVPMLSMELSTLSPVEQNIIRHYLNFYQTHLELFSMGAWQVEYNLSNIAWISVENSQKKIIFLNDAARLDQAIAAANSNQEIYLLNLSEAALEIPGVQAWDVEGKKSPPDHIVCGGRAKISTNTIRLTT